MCVARGCTPPWRGPCALGSRPRRCGNATGRPPLAPRRRGRRCQLVGCPPPSGAPRARPRHPHQVGLAAAALATPASGLVSPACAARRCQCLLRSARLSSAYGGVSEDIICTSCYQCRQRLRPPQHQCLPGPIATRVKTRSVRTLLAAPLGRHEADYIMVGPTTMHLLRALSCPSCLS